MQIIISKPWHCVSGSDWWWWCHGPSGIIYWAFSNNSSLFKIHTLPVHCSWPLAPKSMNTEIKQQGITSHSSNHFKVLSWTLLWVYSTSMASTQGKLVNNLLSNQYQDVWMFCCWKNWWLRKIGFVIKKHYVKILKRDLQSVLTFWKCFCLLIW